MFVQKDTAVKCSYLKGNPFLVPGHQCPVQNFYGKYKKQLLSGNMRERKLICSYKFVKGYQSRKKKSSNFLNTKIFQVQESC